MRRRALNIATAVSAGVGAVTLFCWLACAGGWRPEIGGVSLPELQAKVPGRAATGFAFVGGHSSLSDAAVEMTRYEPLADPIDGPPPEYRGDLFPFTTWMLRLMKTSHAYGFSSTGIPVFDPSRP